MNEVIAFWILSAVAVLGALVAVRKRNLIHGVFALLVFFAGLSGLFLLLLAEFIAAVQVLVYIGAVGILLLFAIMLTERVAGDDDRRMTSRGWPWGLVAAAAVFVLLLLSLSPVQQLSMPKAQDSSEFLTQISDPGSDGKFGTEEYPKFGKDDRKPVEQLGRKLMDPYVVTLEVLALLLTAALIGAVTAAQSVRMPKEEDSPE